MTTRARIVLICHLPPPVHGASMMGQYIVNSELLNETFDCVTIPIRMSDDVDGLGRFSLKKISRACSIFIDLIKALSAKKTSLVYISLSIDGFGLLRDSVSVLICKIFSVRYAFHLHMRGVKERYENSAFYRIIYKFIFSSAEVIHLAPSLYDDVAPLVSQAHFHVVANGVPECANPEGDTSETPEVAPLVLYLSNLLPEKGALDLLAASTLLFAKNIDHRLVFVGAPNDPDLVAEIERAAADNSRITLLPPTYGAAKDELYAKADIFAFPSYYRYECQPLSVMEAMSHNIAIIASRHAAVPDLIRHEIDGKLFEPRNVTALADALGELIADKELRNRLSNSALTRFLDEYTLKAFERRFVSTLERLAL